MSDTGEMNVRPTPAVAVSMPEMVAQAAREVARLKGIRDDLRDQRGNLSESIKNVGALIDQAERVARSLTPRAPRKP